VSATVVVPARLQSSRLPRKVLVDIAGKTMLRRTHEVAVASGCGPVLVLTDSPEVADEVRSFGGEVRMTAADLESGTARIASVADSLTTDVVVNLQGDAPLTEPAVVARAAEEAARTRAPVTMACYPLPHAEDLLDPNVVKVVRAREGRVLYCSRAPVPHVRDQTPGRVDMPVHWAHSGIYAYTHDFLRSFADLPASPLEQAERLEQLRWLEAGVTINSFEVAPQGPSVDTPADLERARDAFAQQEQP
jgi:3-deoxy-D-manno-octulosonate cytidylyltransferase